MDLLYNCTMWGPKRQRQPEFVGRHTYNGISTTCPFYYSFADNHSQALLHIVVPRRNLVLRLETMFRKIVTRKHLEQTND